MTVLDLKQELSTRVNEPVERQRIIFKGRGLTDIQTIQELGMSLQSHNRLR
jgi:hypothetical protein